LEEKLEKNLNKEILEVEEQHHVGKKNKAITGKFQLPPFLYEKKITPKQDSNRVLLRGFLVL
jgi:hypothetical protein